MATRAITGTVYEVDGVAPWANGIVCIAPTFGAYPVYGLTNASGVFLLEVPLSDSGTGSYLIQLPNGQGFGFTMGAQGGTYDISAFVLAHSTITTNPVSIVPTSDIVPLTVSGVLAQTANLVNVLDSTGGNLLNVRSDGLLQATKGVVTKVKAGTPSDADFASAPPSGTVVIDTTADKIWVRVGSTWKFITVA